MENFFLKRCFFNHAAAAFGPCDLPTIQTFVGIGRTFFMRLRLAVHEFPAVHSDLPYLY